MNRRELIAIKKRETHMYVQIEDDWNDVYLGLVRQDMIDAMPSNAEIIYEGKQEDGRFIITYLEPF